MADDANFDLLDFDDYAADTKDTDFTAAAIPALFSIAAVTQFLGGIS